MGAGRIRFSEGPGLAKAAVTTRSSSSMRFACSTAFCWALAMAERSTFSSGPQARLFVFWRIARASAARFPRMRSMTRRAFEGDPLTYLAVAFASTISPPLASLRTLRSLRRWGGRRDLRFSCGLGGMAAERPGGRELAELVTHHILGHVHRNELLSVVDREGVSHHLRNHRRAARPGLHHFLVAPVVHRLDLLQEADVDEGPLFQRSGHALTSVLAAAADDELVGPFVVAGLVSLGGPPPGAHRVSSSRSATLPSAVRMIDGVHRDPAVMGSLPHPPLAPRLSDGDVLVLEVPHLPDRRPAPLVNDADLARRKLELSVLALFGHDLGARPRASRHLAALSRLQLDVVHRGAERDELELQAVAWEDVGRVAGPHRIAHLQAHGVDDVVLLSVGVVNPGDARRAIGVVLDRRHFPRHVDLRPLEVDDAVPLFVAAPAKTHGDASVVVSPPPLVLGLGQGLERPRLGELLEALNAEKPPAGRRGAGLLECHRCIRLPRRTRSSSRLHAGSRMPSSSRAFDPRTVRSASASPLRLRSGPRSP